MSRRNFLAIQYDRLRMRGSFVAAAAGVVGTLLSATSVLNSGGMAAVMALSTPAVLSAAALLISVGAIGAGLYYTFKFAASIRELKADQ